MAEFRLSPILESRRAQAFPALSGAELARLKRFGVARRFADGERLYETGKPAPGMFVVLSGMIRVTTRDGHGHDLPIVDHGPGNFSGEVGQLAGARSFADGVAVGEVEALLLDPERIRAVLVAEADLGEAPECSSPPRWYVSTAGGAVQTSRSCSSLRTVVR